jgi:hypothetical protein
MHDAVVRRVEGFAVVRFRQHGDPAIRFVTHHPVGQVLEGDLPPLPIEGIAITVVRRLAEHRDVTVLVEPAVLHVVRYVTPDQIVSPAAPGRPRSGCG